MATTRMAPSGLHRSDGIYVEMIGRLIEDAELSTTRLSLGVWNVAEAIALPNTSCDQLSLASGNMEISWRSSLSSRLEHEAVRRQRHLL